MQEHCSAEQGEEISSVCRLSDHSRRETLKLERYENHNIFSELGVIHYFQHYHKSTESTLGGGGKSSCMPYKMLVLAIP